MMDLENKVNEIHDMVHRNNIDIAVLSTKIDSKADLVDLGKVKTEVKLKTGAFGIISSILIGAGGWIAIYFKMK